MTTNLRLSESIITAVVDKLQAGLPARIATINAEKPDGIVLAAPGDNDYYLGGIPNGMPGQLPAVIVTETASPEYEAESGASFVYVTEIMVVAVEQDTDRGALFTRHLRWRRAITEVLHMDPPVMSLTGSAFSIRPVRHIPGPVAEPDMETALYRSPTAVIFRCRQFEGP
jgi:hypothetical protein